MKQKRLILTRNPENSTSKLPESIRLYLNSPTETKEFGDKLVYLDGAIPFLITLYKGPSEIINSDFLGLKTQIIDAKKKVSKEYILKNYWVYRIGDYGSQSLSSGFTDIFPTCFFNSGSDNGYKIPQDRIATFRNYTTKETFILLKKKTAEIAGPSLTIVVDFKRNDKLKNPRVFKLTRTDGKFKFNMDSENINSVEEISLSISETVGGITKEYVLTNSDYFMNIEEFDFSKRAGSEFVSQQQKYFDYIQNRDPIISVSKIEIGKRYQIEAVGTTNFTLIGSSSNTAGTKFFATAIPTQTLSEGSVREVLKNSHDITIELNDNFKNVNEINMRSMKEYSEYFFGKYSSLKIVSFDRLRYLSVYRYDPIMAGSVRLVPGYDFYLNSDRKLFIKDAGDNDIFEIILRTTNDNVISFYFDSQVAGSKFYAKRAIYDNFLSKWNVVLPANTGEINKNTTLLIFKDNLLFSLINVDTFPTGKYEFLMENIEYQENSETIPSEVNTVLFLENTNSFDTFNKYQITTDPNLNNFEQDVITEPYIQEVYLYDKDLKFKLDTNEPFIIRNGTSLKVQDYPDIYGALLGDDSSGLIKTYKDFQEDGKFKTELYNNVAVQDIETQLAQTKKNLKAILNNSQVVYTAYQAITSLDSFLFIGFSGTNGARFNITFYDSLNNIIKKEYNCTIVDQKYISIPFFLQILSGSAIDQTKFEIEMLDGPVVSYYIYK